MHVNGSATPDARRTNDAKGRLVVESPVHARVTATVAYAGIRGSLKVYALAEERDPELSVAVEGATKDASHRALKPHDVGSDLRGRKRKPESVGQSQG